jgi:hypothetical protein
MRRSEAMGLRRPVRIWADLMILIVLVCLCGCQEKRLAPAGDLTPSHLQTPNFWVMHTLHSRDVLMTGEQIISFNRQNRWDSSSIQTVFDLPQKTYLDKLERYIKDLAPQAKVGGVYDSEGQRINKEIFTKYIKNANLENIEEINPVRLGILTKIAPIRRLPGPKSMNTRKDNSGIDLNLAGLAGPGTPVAVLWFSRDRKWGLVENCYGRGWVPLEFIALERRPGQVKRFATYKPFVVTASPWTRLESGSAGIIVPMGVRLPIKDPGSPGPLQVWFPKRDQEGYLSFKSAVPPPGNVEKGFVAFTRENALKLAFKWLGEGAAKETMDAEFMFQSIYACFNIRLNPDMVAAGKEAIKPLFLKGVGGGMGTLSDLDRSTPGATILCLKDGLGLYLGKYMEDYYMLAPPAILVKDSKLTARSTWPGTVSVVKINGAEEVDKRDSIDVGLINALYPVMRIKPRNY